MADHARDAAGAEQEGRGDDDRIGQPVGLGREPAGPLLDDDSLAALEDAAGLELDPGALDPLAQQRGAAAGAARAADLDVVGREPDQPVDVAGVEGVVPGRDDLGRAHAVDAGRLRSPSPWR